MISKIYHVADVHIRTYNRHKEYKEVFQRLFDYINATKDENSVIFLAGDIVHSKTDLSPELVSLTADFLKGCADLLPTILILGNHDLNLNNSDRLDALTPIVNSLNHPNLKFWKDTGVYKYNGVAFSVFSVLGPVGNWVLAKDIKAKYKIALHHGAVHNSETDLRYTIQNETVTIDKFEGFDLGLLGDIHKQQFLTPRVAYASSLIQQNMGETVDKHGIIVWDLKTSKGEFVPIRNDHGYYTFEFLDGQCLNPREDLPKYLKVRVKYENTSREDIQKFLKKVGKKCSIQKVTYERKDRVQESLLSRDSIFKDVRDVENQNKLIVEYLNETLGISDETLLDSIRHINRVVNSTLVSNSKALRNITWKPKKFEFDNMFSYGEGNIVDFSDFNGIYGIFAPNAQGKCVHPTTKITIQFDEEYIIQKLGFLPDELK